MLATFSVNVHVLDLGFTLDSHIRRLAVNVNITYRYISSAPYAACLLPLLLLLLLTPSSQLDLSVIPCAGLTPSLPDVLGAWNGLRALLHSSMETCIELATNLAKC